MADATPIKRIPGSPSSTTDALAEFAGTDTIPAANLPSIDHGGLSGLADDDHTQYLNETRHDALAADNPHSVTFSQAVAADAGTNITPAEAETLTDGSNADALHVHAGGASFEAIVFEADQLENPNNSDWAVNALSPLSSDSNNNGFNIRLYDDTTEEGTGFTVEIPATAANIRFDFVSRAESAPGGVRTVGLKMYEREIPDNSAPTSWSAGTALTDVDIPTTELFQYDTQTLTLAALGLTAGSWHQFELTRVNPVGGTELAGDWTLKSIKVSFT